jgi:hypothetical protein
MVDRLCQRIRVDEEVLISGEAVELINTPGTLESFLAARL